MATTAKTPIHTHRIGSGVSGVEDRVRRHVAKVTLGFLGMQPLT